MIQFLIPKKMTDPCVPNSSPDFLSPAIGYWVECVPLRPRSWLHMNPGLYAASVEGFPDARGLGISPDRAIEKLRRRLMQIQGERVKRGENLPTGHNRLAPPKRLQGQIGWMSVFVDLARARDGAAFQKSTFV